MGFDDEQQSLAALLRAQGNLNRAVDILLAGEVPATQTVPSTAAAAAAPAGNDAVNNAENPSDSNQSPKESDSGAPKDSTEKKND